jgi:SAM-dependent methyltransferase
MSESAALRDRLRTRVRARPMDPRVAAAAAARLGRPMLFQLEPAWALDAWTDGGYPVNFLAPAYETLGVTDPSRVLHLCSGGVRSGVTVDIREEVRPHVVADARALPFAAASFDWIMADPPYAETYAEQLYGTGSAYPRPGQILAEAARLLRPGGRFGLLHYVAPMPRAKWKIRLLAVYGCYLGGNMAIRAWSVYEKFGPQLPWGSSPRSRRSVRNERGY